MKYFFVIKKNDFEFVEFSDIDQLSYTINNILSTFNISQLRSFYGYSDIFSDLNYRQAILMSWESTPDNALAFGFLGNKHDFDIVKKGIERNIPYFIFPKIILEDNNYRDIIDETKKKNIKPHILTNLIFSKCLTNPFVLFYSVLSIDKNTFYQAFIHYLNKCIKKSDSIKNCNFLLIRDNFIKNKKIVDVNFDYLFLYYLKSKNLTPINITYEVNVESLF